jgi:hypothetical protein
VTHRKARGVLRFGGAVPGITQRRRHQYQLVLHRFVLSSTRVADAKKPASLQARASGQIQQSSGWHGCWLVLHLVAVFRFGGCLFDGLTRDVHALDCFLFLVTAVLGFVFVTDALCHLISPVLHDK